MTEFVRCDRCGASVEGSSSYDIDGWEDDKWLRRSVPECPYTEPCH